LSPQEIKQILTKYKTVAVVGLSREPDKPSYEVAAYLKKHGFRIVPVNPFADKILGEKSYKSLLEVPAKVQETLEVVNVFRPSKDVPPIVEQVIKVRAIHGKPFVVWMQLGIVNAEAAETARKAGLTVVMGKCIMVEHRLLF
jgi:predicted CoA-binding protein